MRTFLNSGPVKPRRSRKTRMSYFALSAQKGRWFFVLAHFAFLARAAMALCVFGEGGDGEAEDDVAFDLPGVGCTVEGTIMGSFP